MAVITHHSDYRFVAYLDMLGMSALTRRDPDLAWEKLSTLIQARNERLNSPIARLDTGEFIMDQVRSFTFSDTLIAFSRGNTQNDALAMIVLTTELFSLALHYCIPLRGGIAHGRFKFNFDLNLFSGPALVDAYQIGESSQWLGVVVDDRVAELAATIPIQSSRHKDAIVSWNVPAKSGDIVTRKVVNWVETHKNNYRGPFPLEAEEFYAPMATVFGPWQDLPLTVRFKYENTVAFFNAHFVE